MSLGVLKIDNKLSLLHFLDKSKDGQNRGLEQYSRMVNPIYHPDHKWLTVSPDSNDGYWFWDSQ